MGAELVADGALAKTAEDVLEAFLAVWPAGIKSQLSPHVPLLLYRSSEILRLQHVQKLSLCRRCVQYAQLQLAYLQPVSTLNGELQARLHPGGWPQQLHRHVADQPAPQLGLALLA